MAGRQEGVVIFSSASKEKLYLMRNQAPSLIHPAIAWSKICGGSPGARYALRVKTANRKTRKGKRKPESKIARQCGNKMHMRKHPPAAFILRRKVLLEMEIRRANGYLEASSDLGMPS
ncbi:predicted protein [Histoplasma capsulatum H143]|uniref:Uncharacterized protein n=1 Tax=Ajellomyces capsulatus (strain H143) TaxID=544712 RepID=C6H3M8_AJECH|nr:predicted protein [Histoplasma capsulatum H143]